MSEHGHIKFWQEIGRRNVLRVAAVYVGFSWAVVHSGVVVGEALELPHWIMRFVSAVLIVGFPAVVAFAWVYEITPEGLKRTQEVERESSITHRTAHRLNIVIIVLMLLLAGLYGADRFLLKHEGGEGAAHVAADGAPKAPAAEAGVSIAVLPFLDLSPAKDQEYFSDGMTEEITTALAKVNGLKVVARTSAFEFKGQNKDLRAIGQTLGVANLLEGSVRKAGNRVRITGQLIRASDGTHLWTEDYDRELTDVFATQDDIARAIVTALRVPLGLKEGETLVSDRAISPDDYQDYLRAKALVRGRLLGTSLQEPIGLLERVVERDPGYAPAWALLAMGNELAPIYDVTPRDRPEERRVFIQTVLSRAEVAGRRAMELDPRNADAIAGLGAVLMSRGRYVEAEDLFRQALKLDAFNPEALNYLGGLLGGVGRSKDSIAIREQLQSIEPRVPAFQLNTSVILWAAGRTDAALSLMESLPPRTSAVHLARYYAAVGQYKRAADMIAGAPPGAFVPEQGAIAVRLLNVAPASAAGQSSPDLGSLSFVYLYTGLPDRALDQWAQALESGNSVFTYFYEFLHPRYAPVRKTARFKELVRKAGFVDYWRARGWPEFCHPVGADDFACS